MTTNIEDIYKRYPDADEAVVYGNAKVYGSVVVYGDARVSDNDIVTGETK